MTGLESNGEKSNYLAKLRQLDEFVAGVSELVRLDIDDARVLVRKVIRFCREFGGTDRVYDALDANELLEDAAKAFGIIAKCEAERGEADHP